jgi:aspartate racemase
MTRATAVALGRRKTVGVIGGMGPAATAEFFRCLVEATEASRDQDHLRVLIDSDPTIPDRTLALVGGGSSPLADLVRVAQHLENMGADLLVMPCNTAHAYVNEVARAVSIPLVSWVEETAAHIAALEPRPVCAGLLATTGTVASGVYQAALAAAGVEAIIPNDTEQQQVMAAVYGLKGGEPTQPSVSGVLALLVSRGADVIVLGCTELPALALDVQGVRLVDPAPVVAARVVELAGGVVKRAATVA